MRRREFIKIVAASTFISSALKAQEIEWIRPIWGLQAWWTDGEAKPGSNSTHLHLDTDFPVGYGIKDYDGKITTPNLIGIVKFSVQITIHDALIGSKLTTTQIYSEPAHKIVRTINWNKTINTTDNISFAWTGDIDTTKQHNGDPLVGYNGRQEYRFLTKLNRPDGNSLRVTSGLQAYVDNPGKIIKHARNEYWQEARGWYDFLDYENARFLSGIPRKPLTGLWLPKIACVPGSGGTDVTSFWVVLDPQNHFENPGTLIFSGNAEYTGLISVNCNVLSAGLHKLVLLTHSQNLESDDPTQHGTLTGVLSIPFTVE